jgi:hypothetical protein
MCITGLFPDGQEAAGGAAALFPDEQCLPQNMAQCDDYHSGPPRKKRSMTSCMNIAIRSEKRWPDCRRATSLVKKENEP